MDIEKLKELKEQIRGSHDGINGDDLNLLYELLPLVDESIEMLEKEISRDEFSVEVREALAKGKPMKPIHKEKNLYCPNCDRWLLWDDAIPNESDNYCGICGQKIDWTED